MAWPIDPGPAAAGWLSRIAGGDLTVIAIVSVGLLVIVALLFASLLLARRRFRADLREVVRALERLREGQLSDSTGHDAASPLALVFDSIQRLGQDVVARQRGSAAQGERVRRMLDVIGDSAVLTTDEDGDIRSFSQGAVELFGWEEREILSQPWSVLFEEAAYKDFLPKLARRSLREQGIQVRAVLQRHDGTHFAAEVSVRVLHAAESQPAGLVLSVRDIGPLNRLEHELRDAEERYRSLAEGLVEGVVIVRGGALLYANPAAAQLFGDTPARLSGEPLRDRVATRDVLLIGERLEELQSGAQTATSFQCRLLAPDGSIGSEVQVQASVVSYDGSAAALLLLRDVSAEQRVQAELQRNEQRLDAVLEAASDGIGLIVDVGDSGSTTDGGIVQMVNTAFLDLFGLRQDEVLGATEATLLARLAKSGAGGRALARTIRRAGHRAVQETLDLEEGSLAELAVSITPLQSARNARLGRVLACRDLSERVDSERKLQQHTEQLQLSKIMLEQAYKRLESLHRDLRDRNAQLDGVNRELRKLDEMKSNLLGNVSHELQTPLVSIRGYTEMMLKQRLGTITEEQRKGLTLCLKNIDRLISMIDNLLVLARAEDEEGSLKLTRFALRSVVEDSAELLRDKMRERGISLTVELPEEILEVQADRDRVQQVFINLLSNAIKFNRPGGHIGVSATRKGTSHTEVLVEDSGTGISAEMLPRIFERNFQVRSGTEDSPEGSGIGLAIVKQILQSHGCRIDVESDESKGTRFRFTLPLGPSTEAIEGAASAPPPDVPPGVGPTATPGERPTRLRIIRPEDPT